MAIQVRRLGSLVWLPCVLSIRSRAFHTLELLPYLTTQRVFQLHLRFIFGLAYMRIKEYNTTMRRTNINLREDQWKKLKALSEETGATPSALIRKAIDAYLKRGK